MSPNEYCEVTSTTATELHNESPNHWLATRNLSSSCEQTPTPGWRREYRGDGWRSWESRPEKKNSTNSCVVLHNVLSAWAIFQSQERRNRTLYSICASLRKKGSGSNLHFWGPQPRMSSPWKKNNKIRGNKRWSNSTEELRKKTSGAYFVFPCSSFVSVTDSKQENAMHFPSTFLLLLQSFEKVFVNCYEVSSILGSC